MRYPGRSVIAFIFPSSTNLGCYIPSLLTSLGKFSIASNLPEFVSPRSVGTLVTRSLDTGVLLLIAYKLSPLDGNLSIIMLIISLDFCRMSKSLLKLDILQQIYAEMAKL